MNNIESIVSTSPNPSLQRRGLRYCFLAFTAIFCLQSFLSFAQDETVIEIDKIVIVESLVDEISPVEASTTVQIKSTAPKVESAADVVSQTAGVHIRRFGGLEEATSISIRGSSAAQVQVFLDGVPLETASNGGVGLNQIAASSLSKIEIYKSFTPSEFGGGAVGGVVSLNSKKVQQGIHHRYGFGFGSFLTFDGLGAFSYGGEQHDVILGVDFRRTKGNFTYLDNNGTPLNLSDDRRVKRQNNHHLLVHPSLKWNYRFDERTELSWANHFFRIESGVPGLGNFQSRDAHLAQTEWITSLQLKRNQIFGGKTRVHNNFYLRWIKSQFDDPGGEIGLGIAQNNDDRTIVFGDRLIFTTEFHKNFLLKEGLEYIFEEFSPKDYAVANPYGSSSKRQQINLFIEPHLYLFDQKVLLSLQAQSMNSFYDVNDDDPSLNAPGTFFSNRKENDFAGTFLLKYSPLKILHFKGSIGRAVRLPKFVEMFGDQGNILGNPRLSSEKSFKFDVGVLYAQKFQNRFLKKLSLEANYFESNVDDLIQFELASGYARASNIGEALVRGAEFVLNARFEKFFELFANYTFQRAKDEAIHPGHFLVGRPEHELNAGLNFRLANFSAGTALNFVDNQYLDALNTQRVEHRLILNFDMAYLLKERYRLGFEVKNVTNSQVVDAVGFPLPGRSFFGRVDVLF